jgi:choline dehydrogenase
VLANRLTEREDVKVLLLEAGMPDQQMEIHIPIVFAKLFKTPFDWNYNTVSQAKLKNRSLYWPRGRVLGGSSSINAMIYIRGNHLDYDNWKSLGNEGWSFADVLPYFKKSENQERGQSYYHGIGGPLNVADLRTVNPLTTKFVEATKELGFAQNDDFNGATQEGFGNYQVTQKGGKRCSAAVAYLLPALSRPNLIVQTQAQVTKLIIENNKVTGVAYLLEGKEQIANVEREVILCGGSINSPQILMLSGIGPADELKKLGINVVNDLAGVGQNLKDHLFIAVSYACKEPISLATAETPENIAEFMQFGRGALTSNVGEAGGFIKTDSSLSKPNLQFHFAPVYYLNHGFAQIEGHGLTIGPTLINPRSSGYIKLNSADPLIHPVIEPCYLSDEDDMNLLVQGVKLAKEIAATKAFEAYCGAPVCKELSTDKGIKNFIRDVVETIYHPTGTCKMGIDSMAVVDSQLKVYGIDNLRVVDGSIMPTIVSGNTNAPIIMIAEKVADAIKEKI